ncbi:MAG TPA: bacteriohopanetetrol glucosamine biosynthesis glycosyltransferase HpnI [Candidatus Baltobacteraceae bacterium]
MFGNLLPLIAVFALLVTAVGFLYTLIAVQRMHAFGRRRAKCGPATAPVTVLKPLHGLEAGLFENLCSFCDQQYPLFQVVFGVADARDPAIAVVERVMAQYPALDITLIVNERIDGRNPKVSNLANMMPAAKHDLVFIADADMRVDSNYLRTIVSELQGDGVGAVTCLYAGVPFGGRASKLGAAYINDHFAPSVLVALVLGQLNFCMGSTMAIRRQTLEAVGGLAALGTHLGDDFTLGQLVRAAGLDVVLSSYVVRNVVCEPELATLWEHEMRWARTVRVQHPIGYAFLFLTYPLPFAVLYLALTENAPLGLIALALAAIARIALARASQTALNVRAKQTLRWIPIRDALSLVIWAGSFFGREVRWRGQRLRISTDGRLDGDPSS